VPLRSRQKKCNSIYINVLANGHERVGFLDDGDARARLRQEPGRSRACDAYPTDENTHRVVAVVDVDIVLSRGLV
jgi:hypothetical protein